MIDRTPCPFVKTPFDDCYVSSMNSDSIDAAVHYCGGNFRECEIYMKHADRGQGKKMEKRGETSPIKAKGGET